MITRCFLTLDYPGQPVAMNAQNGVVVMKQKLCPRMSIRQVHYMKEPNRESIDVDDNSDASSDSFHSIEDDGRGTAISPLK